MQLSSEHQKYLMHVMTKGDSLQAILEEEYPLAEIHLVRGLDQFYGDRYVASAFFSREAAIEDLRAKERNPNGSHPDISDRFYLIVTSPQQLKAGTPDPETKLHLDEIDVDMAYSFLARHYAGRKMQ